MIARTKDELIFLLDQVSAGDDEARFLANFVQNEGVSPTITVEDGKRKMTLPPDWNDDKFLLWPNCISVFPLAATKLTRLVEQNFRKRGGGEVNRTLLLITDDDTDPFVLALALLFTANCIYEFHRAARLPKLRVKLRGYPLEAEYDLSYHSFPERGLWHYEASLLIARLLQNKVGIDFTHEANVSRITTRQETKSFGTMIDSILSRFSRAGINFPTPRSYTTIARLTAFSLIAHALPESVMRQILENRQSEHHPIASAFYAPLE